MTEVLERATGEVVYSKDNRYERYYLSTRYSDEIVKLSQVRGEQNIVKPELAADVRLNGLINPIDVAVVPEELLADYLAFVRETWGEAAELADFQALRQEDGLYSLLIAGHSRHQAIEDNEEEDFLETGQLIRYPIPVKIHAVESVWDIIRIQLGENIHSQPPKERQAIALVDAFEYGLAHGQWNSADEFLAMDEHKNISSNSLQQALQFRRLPPEVRSRVLAGPIHYYAGIELSKTVEPLRAFYVAKLGVTKDDYEERIEVIDELVKDELIILCNNIFYEKLNSTASKARIKKWRTFWVEGRKALVDDPSRKGMLELEFATEDMGALLLQQKKDEIKRQVRALATHQGSEVAILIQLAEKQVGREVVEECLAAQVEDARGILTRTRHLGARAPQAAEVLSLLEVE